MTETQHDDLILAVATAPRGNSPHWKNDTVAWWKLLTWVDSPAHVKDCGNYMLGELAATPHLPHKDCSKQPCTDLHRNREAVVHRSGVTLDVDYPDAGFLERLADLGWETLVHTTYSSTPASPRYRVILPANRSVLPDEYRTLTKHLMRELGQEVFDKGSAEPERYMFRPSAAPGQTIEHWHFRGPLLNVDEQLVDAAMAALEEPEEAREEPIRPEADMSTPPTEEELSKAQNTLAKAQREIPELRNPKGEEADGRNRAVYDWLLPLYSFVKADCLDRDDVDEKVWDAVMDAPGDHPYERGEFKETQESAWDIAVPQRPDVFAFDAVAGDDHDDTPPKSGKRPPQAVQMVTHVRAHYNVFPAGDDGRVFAQPKKGGRAELVTGPFVLRATRELGLSGSSLTTAATEAAKQIAWGAEDAPERSLALRVHYKPGRIVLDLAHRGSGQCVVVTADGWKEQEQPPADVVFHASGRPLPSPQRGGSIEELRSVLRWKADDPRWLLIKGWLPASLLAGRPRPMLGFFGEKGAAKTTTGWFVVGVLDPKPADPMTLGSGFGKQRSDDETKALKSYLPAWDNVSSLSDEGADFLSRLVTGDNIERRKLYSDSDVITLNYRRTGVITGVTVPRGLKVDTQDRLIMIRMHAPEAKERVTEESLLEEWAKVHPRVLGGVLDLAVRMLARMGKAPNTAGKRMADYASALWAVDPKLYDAFTRNHDNAEVEMAEEDPFVQTLLAHLRSSPGGKFHGTAEEMRKAAEWHMVSPGEQSWPSNAKSFMDWVTRASALLKAVGITVGAGKSNGARIKKFELTEEREPEVDILS